jgi:hypothetical protein
VSSDAGPVLGLDDDAFLEHVTRVAEELMRAMRHRGIAAAT